jgi:hypothetical protein
LRFNKEGNLLAVTTADNGFKILANVAGIRSLRAIETPSFEALRSPIESASAKVETISFSFIWFFPKEYLIYRIYCNLIFVSR